MPEQVPECAVDEETAQQLLEVKYEQNYGTFMEFLLGAREREAARLNAATDALAAEAAVDTDAAAETVGRGDVLLVLPAAAVGNEPSSIGVRFAPLASTRKHTRRNPRHNLICGWHL